MWGRMDRDASGELDIDELREGMLANKMDTEGGVGRIFAAADADGDGNISKKEFLQYFEGLKHHPPFPELGPVNPEVFHEFLAPLVENYFDELPW
eukprot:SAG22_NODE_302_length_12743_cov_12.397738_17_plen_95_part_00